ncbi:MAG TPA: ABC transporter ATP-binding protein [Rubrobacteraceae bacterium]|nr:ABC transporter ATP-binding protein [Rubrobacteraceae bacterium]
MRGTPLRGPVISLEGVRKSFGGFELGPVDLQVEPGQLVAVVGPGGSGKSALFEILMNVMVPDRGEVRLFGGTYPREEVPIKQRIGYVPELAVGHDDMRAKDLAEFVSYWYPRWDWRLYEELAGRLDREERTNKRFGRLSRGEQRRLLFALAAATGADLLLLDEPTSGLDPLSRREMLDDILRFMDEGENRAVVFSTHVMEEVRQIGDYVVVLVDGELRGPFEKEDILSRWKTFWVDREPEVGTPGVVEGKSGSPACIVTDSPEETERALDGQGVGILRSGSSALEDILAHLMRRRKERSRA